MSSEIESSVNQLNTFGENLLEASLEKLNHTATNLSSGSYRRRGCPVDFSFSNDPLSTNFTPHYELNLIFHSYDFLFDKLNYETEELYKQSKTVRSYPHHLRSTLFISNEKIKQLRKRDFTSIFMVGEEIKDKANKCYNDNQYYEALSLYSVIYSLYRWIEFKDKKREAQLFSKIYEINKNPIIDDDIVVKTVKINKRAQYEVNNLNSAMLFVLKALSYCYIHLRAYSEAIKCIDEAFEYCDDSLPDLYFRRAQARMFNKYSTIEELKKALTDFKKAQRRKRNEKTIDDQCDLLCKMIKEKEEKEFNKIKSNKYLLLYRFRTNA